MSNWREIKPQVVEEIVRLYKGGMIVADIGRHLKMWPNTVRTVLVREKCHKITKRGRPQRVETDPSMIIARRTRELFGLKGEHEVRA